MEVTGGNYMDAILIVLFIEDGHLEPIKNIQ